IGQRQLVLGLDPPEGRDARLEAGRRLDRVVEQIQFTEEAPRRPDEKLHPAALRGALELFERLPRLVVLAKTPVAFAEPQRAYLAPDKARPSLHRDGLDQEIDAAFGLSRPAQRPAQEALRPHLVCRGGRL